MEYQLNQHTYNKQNTSQITPYKMIIFILAFIVLIIAILTNFLQPLRKYKVLAMSILSILMIMINFINQIDVVMSPPQYSIKNINQDKKSIRKQIITINFKQQLQSKDLKYFQQEIQMIRKQIYSEVISNQTQEAKQKIVNSLSYIDKLSKEHYGPLIKEQVYLMQKFRVKALQKQDWLVQVEGISKSRFQTLFQWYIKDLNQKSSSYGIKYNKILVKSLYQQNLDSSQQNIIYKISQKLSNQDYHYVVVYDSPSYKILNLLYESYLSSKPSYFTVIFLDVRQNFNIFPISSYVQQIQFMAENQYLRPILDILQTKDKKKDQQKEINIQKINKINKQIEVCQRYLQVDFELYINVLANIQHKNIAEICYDIVQRQLTEQMLCLRKFIHNQDQTIPYKIAKKCWINKNQPKQIYIQQGKVKLKKQHFWAHKLSPLNFGLDKVINQNCSQQL